MTFRSLLWSASRPVGVMLAACLAVACGGGDTTGSGASGPTGGGGTGGSSVGGGGSTNVGGSASTGGGGSASTGGSASGGGGSGGTATGGTGGSGASSNPGIGAHGLSYYRHYENNFPTIESPPLDTQPTGSTLIVSTGRGDFSAFAVPSDNKGNPPIAQLGAAHTYTFWPTSGTALYGLSGVTGGAGHVVSNTNAIGDEITMAVVEVTGSTHIQDFQWVEKINNGQSITSAPVTTTGPATLVAFWWGDGGADGDKVAVPNNGFTVLDSIGEPGSLVQCFVAAKVVDQAGTYDVTWEATPSQGAQLWLVAVE